jgi:signal transduction histidine kinase
VRSVLEYKRTVLVERLSSEWIASLSQGEEHLQAFRAADLKSLIAVPLLARGKLVGVIALISSSNRMYGTADIYLAEELARRAALSIENARLFDEAQLAVNIRDEVLAVVAHDLGNPLLTISLTANALTQFEQLDRANLKDFTARILRSVDNMRSLIADLLDFARIQSGTFSVTKHVDSLLPLLMAVVDVTRVQAEAKNQMLEVDLPSGLPEVMVDAHRIGQVISNLLGNAVKFTPERGKIRLSGRHRGNTVIVSVSDTGPGIAPEDLSRVFDRFWQAQKTTYTGSGLGLSIAKGIIDAHGGAIWAESQIGQGSSFSFTLPVVDQDTTCRDSAA